MLDADESDPKEERFSGLLPIELLFPGNAKASNILLTVWKSSLAIFIVTGLFTAVFAVSGRFLPQENATWDQIISVFQNIIPALDAGVSNNTRSAINPLTANIQVILLFGWAVTLGMYVIFWCGIKNVDRKRWRPFREKINKTKERDSYYVASIFGLIFAIFVVYFDFAVSFSGRAEYLFLLISVSFFGLIYGGQTGILLILSHVFGNRKTQSDEC